MTNASLVREYAILFVGGLPIMLILGKLFFGSWADFFDALRLALTPDIISCLRGEGLEDLWATCKLLLFVLLCGATLFFAHAHFFAQPLPQ